MASDFDGSSRATQPDSTWLINENRTLRDENEQLRHFIASLKGLMDAADHHAQQETVEDTVEVLERIICDAMQVTNAKDASLLVKDDDTEELVFVISKGDVPPDDLFGKRIPAGEGIAGWAVNNRKPLIVEKAQMDERFFGGVDKKHEFKTRNILAVPIIGGDRILGVLEVLNKEHGMNFTEDDQDRLTILCRFAGELLYSLEQFVEGHSITLTMRKIDILKAAAE